MTRLSATLLWLLLSATTLFGQPTDSPVRLSETYELANIILALTDYGKTDPWEVSKGSAYYREVRTYFDAYSNHPLLQQVNYSRQQWENYLSFRTDAYAFSFDSTQHLVRCVAFTTNQGFNPFEENLKLIEDFVRTTGFRTFYQQHLPYYQELATAYLRSQHYPEMMHFLQTEFGNQSAHPSYAIVVSPLVGRMNCHRTVAGIGTDFSTLPGFLLAGQSVQSATPNEIASGTHMLFTELDHAFVNPVSERYRSLIHAHFPVKRWDSGSGYEVDSLASFNEYMTWAVYDLFVQQYFPAVAANVSTDWALQNETRGFYASTLFNKELASLYNQRKPGQTLTDLYPAFLKRLGSLQHHLRQPRLVQCLVAHKPTSDTSTTYTIEFSEPMNPLTSIATVRVSIVSGKEVRQPVVLSPSANHLRWSANHKKLQFSLPPAKGSPSILLFNYPWQTPTPLQSQQGITLAPYCRMIE